MAKFSTAFLLSLLTTAVAGNYIISEKPGWVKKLQGICQGAPDLWYVDRSVPRCCKCAKCIDLFEQPMAECSSPNWCATKNMWDCVGEDDKERIASIFSPLSTAAQSTTPPDLVTELAVNGTEAATVEISPTNFTSMMAEEKPVDSDGNPWMWMTIGIVAVFVLCATCVLVAKVRKGRCFMFMVGEKIHFCPDSKSSDSAGCARDKGDPGISSRQEEVAMLINQGPGYPNQSPPSEFGPPGMCSDFSRNITGDLRSDHHSSQNLPPMQSQRISRVTSNDAHAAAGNCCAPHLMCQATENGTINIQNMNVYACTHTRQAQELTNAESHVAAIARQGTVQGSAVGQGNLGDRSRCRYLASQAEEREVSPNATPPISRPDREMTNRQSSVMSSTTATGRVENASGFDIACEKWQVSSAHADQEREFACYQRASLAQCDFLDPCKTGEKSFCPEVHRRLPRQHSGSQPPQSDVEGSKNSL